VQGKSVTYSKGATNTPLMIIDLESGKPFAQRLDSAYAHFAGWRRGGKGKLAAIVRRNEREEPSKFFEWPLPGTALGDEVPDSESARSASGQSVHFEQGDLV
jgi:hypothetical protein